MISDSYANALLAVIQASAVQEKAELLGALQPPADGSQWPIPAIPARPGRPAGVREGQPPRRRRGLHNPLSRAQFLHAIWHIECTAIDLAALCSLAGSGMPQAFHHDQLQVAREEAEHAQMIATLLHSYNRPPGHDAVHHRLWDAARACANLGEHLVVIPRFLEARGLDVNADVLPRLAAADPDAEAVLRRIYEDEITHVGIGSRWHQHWCTENGHNPQQHFRQVLEKHGLLRFPSPAPLDEPGRRAAGFADEDIQFLNAAQQQQGSPL